MSAYDKEIFEKKFKKTIFSGLAGIENTRNINAVGNIGKRGIGIGDKSRQQAILLVCAGVFTKLYLLLHNIS